jgi:hypothetical protein
MAACWRDGILLRVAADANTAAATVDAACDVKSTTEAPSNAAGCTTNSSDGQVLYDLVQNKGIFASNYVPLWTGLTEGPDESRGQRVVQSLQQSKLMNVSGESALSVAGGALGLLTSTGESTWRKSCNDVDGFDNSCR